MRERDIYIHIEYSLQALFQEPFEQESHQEPTTQNPKPYGLGQTDKGPEKDNLSTAAPRTCNPKVSKALNPKP